jgi:hypothetical protein
MYYDVKMDYKGILTHTLDVTGNSELVKVTYDELNAMFRADRPKTTPRDELELNVESIEVITEWFSRIKTYVSEFGFMDTSDVGDFFAIMRKNTIKRVEDTNEYDVNVHDDASAYELLPHEERCLYER